MIKLVRIVGWWKWVTWDDYRRYSSATKIPGVNAWFLHGRREEFAPPTRTLTELWDDITLEIEACYEDMMWYLRFSKAERDRQEKENVIIDWDIR